MKKLVLFGLGLVLASSLSFAQFFTFGVKGGVGITNFNSDLTNVITPTIDGGIFDPSLDFDINVDELILSQKSANYGYHFGAFARIKVLGIYIQPELYFSSVSSDLTIEEIVPTAGQDIDVSLIQNQILSQTYNKLDMPILVGLKLGPLRVNAGPVATFIVNNKSEMQEMITDYETALTKATFGYQAGLGLDLLKKVTIDIRYEGSLSDYGTGATVGGNQVSFDDRPSQFIASIGIMF